MAQLLKHQIATRHVPTGSSLSQLVSFYASLEMFEEIATLANTNGITFTVYVDDLTFSGDVVTGEFIWAVKQVISKYGYEYHKEFSSPPEKPKLVTGVAIHNKQMKVQNKHHKAIFDLYIRHLNGELTDQERSSLFGRLSSASQVSKKHGAILRHIL